MKWFKHLVKLSDDARVSLLEQKYGLEGYAVYLKLIELTAREWDGLQEPVFIFNKEKLKTNIGKISKKKLDKIISEISLLGLFVLESREFDYKIIFEKLREIKDKTASNKKQKKEKPAKQNEIKKDESKNLILEDFKEFGNFIFDTSKKTQELWLSTYEKSFIIQEFKKMQIWLETNKHKAPKKHISRFISSWLSRAWEAHRKTITGKPVKNFKIEILEKIKNENYNPTHDYNWNQEQKEFLNKNGGLINILNKNEFEVRKIFLGG